MHEVCQLEAPSLPYQFVGHHNLYIIPSNYQDNRNYNYYSKNLS